MNHGELIFRDIGLGVNKHGQCPLLVTGIVLVEASDHMRLESSVLTIDGVQRDELVRGEAKLLPTKYDGWRADDIIEDRKWRAGHSRFEVKGTRHWSFTEVAERALKLISSAKHREHPTKELRALVRQLNRHRRTLPELDSMRCVVQSIMQVLEEEIADRWIKKQEAKKK